MAIPPFWITIFKCNNNNNKKLIQILLEYNKYTYRIFFDHFNQNWFRTSDINAKD